MLKSLNVVLQVVMHLGALTRNKPLNPSAFGEIAQADHPQ